jgi:hypothetical protein
LFFSWKEIDEIVSKKIKKKEKNYGKSVGRVPQVTPTLSREWMAPVRPADEPGLFSFFLSFSFFFDEWKPDCAFPQPSTWFGTVITASRQQKVGEGERKEVLHRRERESAGWDVI